MGNPLQVDLFTTVLESKWKAIKNAKTGFFSSSIDFTTVTNFIISSLDEAIKYAQLNILTNGEDKKAFVMAVISRLYDTVIGANLPYWLYPFAGSVKNLVLNVIVANAIDWIVSKYKAGVWNLPTV